MILIIFLIAYLIGSIPFGLILVRLAGKGDIRKIGSGNIGATNVLRTGSKKLAALTLLLDGGKGAILFYIINANFCGCKIPFDMFTSSMLALGVLLGHIFPIWLKFEGGKGVATALGIYFGLDWHIGVIACIAWLISAIVFRYSSLAAILTLIVAFIVPATQIFAPNWLYEDLYIPSSAFNLTIITFAIALIVIARHHANIRRLLNGTEPKIGQGKIETPHATP